MSWKKAPKEAEACKDFAERALKRIAELEAEARGGDIMAAKDAERIADLEEYNIAQGDALRKLRAENARLRELLAEHKRAEEVAREANVPAREGE